MNNQRKWMAIKELLMQDLPEKHLRTFDVCLENTMRENTRNQKAMLFENASSGATGSGNIAALNRVILPLMRRVLPGIIAPELVGVQPMPGPWAQVQTLRVRYAQTAGGVAAHSEAFAPVHIQDVAAAYSGNADSANPAAGDTTYMEGVPGNAITVDITREQVKAMTRRLSARWTIEAAQDSQALYGVDLESEIMTAVAHELTVEIDQQILRRLRTLPPPAGTANTYDQSAVSGVANSVVDEHAALAVMILKEANDIGIRIRRGGPGNWAVVSSTALTILQSAKASAFALTTKGDLEGPSNTKLVGTLNGVVGMKIYLDAYATAATSVLVGYKGNTEVDAGTFFCPYVPLTSTNPIMDPNTFEPVVGFMTRYGWLEFLNRTTSFGNSADYYGLVGINSSTVSFF